jgi:hypothetical protein
VETVVVAFGDEKGNKLDGIRPKRARNFSERGEWFNRTLTQQFVSVELKSLVKTTFLFWSLVIC